MINVRQYDSNTWMVRRWDRFNGNIPTKPESFCQFWRTVLLWSTLASIPLLGRALMLTHLEGQQDRSEPLFDEQIDYIVGILDRIVRPPAEFIWWILWPLRVVVYVLWRGACTIAARIDEADTKRLEDVFAWAVGVVLAGIAAFVLFILTRWLIEAWQASWVMFLAIGLGTPSILVLGWLIGYHTYQPASQFVQLVWQILVVSKHRVCPPVKIVR